MPSIQADGLEIVYDTMGAGPPLVLLHGASSSGREDFAAQIPSLTKAFHLYLPDARGHGRTRWDVAEGFAQERLVADLEAFVDELGLRTFHLFGFSMGAMTAMRFATRHADRLRTLILVGITPEREPRATIARRLMDPARIDPIQGVGAWQRLLPAIAAEIGVQPLLTPKDLHSIAVPTMVVCGDRDPFVPVDHAWGLARAIPRARLLVVPDSPHEVLSRQPAVSNAALAGFYRSTEVEARARAEEVLR